MKALVASDLHLEFHCDGGRYFVSTLADAAMIIVAGDLTVDDKIPDVLKLLAKKYKKIVYVSGNHEFYCSSLQGINSIRGSIKSKKIHWLENQCATINNVHFVGCTLWFPGGYHLDQTYYLNDFLVIEGFSKWVGKKNEESLQFLRDNVTGDSVVVTHHAPSQLSVEKQFKNSNLNCFFVCPAAEKIIEDKQPRYWFHGHMHGSRDYMIGKTRVVCNPFGYMGRWVNPNFTNNLIIDL